MDEEKDWKPLTIGDIVIMVDPGPEHRASGLYVGVETTILDVEEAGRFVYVAGKGRFSKDKIGCFGVRVKLAPVQRELF